MGKHACQANKWPGIIPLGSLEQDFVILGGEANIHSCVYSLPMGSSAEENTRNLSANCQAWVSSPRVPPAPHSPGRVPQLTLCACGVTKELRKRQLGYLCIFLLESSRCCLQTHGMCICVHRHVDPDGPKLCPYLRGSRRDSGWLWPNTPGPCSQSPGVPRRHVGFSVLPLF